MARAKRDRRNRSAPRGPITPTDGPTGDPTHGLLHELGVMGNYDPRRFYTGNPKGEKQPGYPQQIWLSATMHARISRAVAEVPSYASKADFIRDAIHHRLQWLADNYDSLADPLTPVDQYLDYLATTEAEIDAVTATPARIREVADKAIQAGEAWKLRAVLDGAERLIEQLAGADTSLLDAITDEIRRARAGLARMDGVKTRAHHEIDDAWAEVLDEGEGEW